MRDRFLMKLAGWHAAHPGRMAVIALALTLVLGMLATRLTVSMRWADLLPAKDPRTVQYQQIIDAFKTATSIVVVLQGETGEIKAFADALAPRLLALRDEQGGGPLIQRVDYKREEGFFRDHGLRLIKAEDLKNLQDVFTDPNLDGLLFNLNNALEKEYTQRESPLSSREKEDGAVAFVDGIDGLVGLLQAAAQGDVPSEVQIDGAVDRLLLGEPYFLSYDRRTLILNAIPTFSVVDIDLMVRGTDAVQALVDELRQDFPNVQAGLTGMIPLGRDEMVYSEQSMGLTTGVAVVAILILLMIAFRLWVAPLLAMGSLLLGLVWAVGLTAALVGQLNIMTQMMAVILLGLGIDFSIHLISGFTERRAQGDRIDQALETTFLTHGKGVVTGALTTAFAFLTLLISSSRGMKEMGLVTGAGLLAILAATFMILPILLVWRERRLDRRIGQGKAVHQRRDLSFAFMGRLGQTLASRRWLTLAGALVLTGLMGWQASQIGFDQNYLNMEPKGLKSVTLNDTIQAKFDLSMDYALILADTPEESRELAKAARKLGSVAMVEDIGAYLPSEDEQAERNALIQALRGRLRPVTSSLSTAAWARVRSQVDRLEMNVIELQDLAYMGMQDRVEARCTELVGHPEKPERVNRFETLRQSLDDPAARSRLEALHRRLAPRYHRAVDRLCRPGRIALADLPQSVRDRYGNAELDQFLITVYPSASIWSDLAFMDRFTSDLEGLTPRVTGMPSIFYALIHVIGRDGRNALLLTTLVIFFLLWADFRNVRHALLAMVPLAAGLVWMVGFMKLAGLSFTVINVMGLPMILGIGIDDGVHLVHRWVAEGQGNLRRVFASTGKAVLLTSLTTMLGFGSLVFSIYRGFASLGGALFLGVAACFLTTVLFLAALLAKRGGEEA